VRPRSDIALAVALAGVACVAAAFVPASATVVRAILALPLVLVLPGYAAAAALFAPQQLRGAERALLALVLSIVETLFAGVVLDVIGVGLSVKPWLGILVAATLAGAVVAARRGHARPLPQLRLRLRFGEVTAIAVGVALLSGAAALGFSPLSAPSNVNDASSVILIAPREHKTAVQIYVISDELHEQSYRVTVTRNAKVVRRFGPFSLAPGASWTRTVAVGRGLPRVEALLHRPARSLAVYKSVFMSCWCVASAGGGGLGATP